MSRPIPWNDDESPAALETAFADKDFEQAGLLLDALSADLDRYGRRIEAGVAKKVLALLRQYAWFSKLAEMAAIFEKHAQRSPQVILQLAQARIELGEITTAVELLTDLRRQIEQKVAAADDALAKKKLEHLLSETLGLLGRSYKQYYVDARPSRIEPRESDLSRALEYYGVAYERGIGDFLWHGINRVALLTHQKRVQTGQRNAISEEAEAAARKILHYIRDNDLRDHWDIANRIEGNLAIGNTPAAIAATQEYLQVADAFAIQSTRRQLKELWLLDEERPPGNQILPMMTARVAELGGASEAMELDLSRKASYEAVWGETGYQPLRWLTDALERAKSVARIGPNKYDGKGSGFLLDGARIGDAWAGRPLLLTNAHVCSDEPAVQKQYPYPAPHSELTAAFLGEGAAAGAAEIRFRRLVWSSAPSELDATLLELEAAPAGAPVPPITTRNPPVTQHGNTRLNILGHPKGLDLRISLQDNKLVEVDERRLYYRTPTDPGSSGSPVFDQDWKLVALHHAASAEKQANEGIRIDRILEAIRASGVRPG